MTNEQQKPATPAIDPAPAPAPQEGQQQSQSPTKPSTDKPGVQPQQK
jgi:hypothetical protein